MKRTISILLAVLMLPAVLAGCGRSSSDHSGSTAAAGAYREEYYDDYNYHDYDYNYEYGYYDESVTMAEEAFDAAYANLNASAQKSVQTTPQKIIYTADIDMETLEFDETLAALAALTESCGGYFEQSSVNDRGSYRTAYYSVRVPAENYREFLGGADGLGHVTSQQEQAEDVSEVYYDTAGRLGTQNTKLARLQELLTEAENMEDIIVIEEAISETEEMIDRLSGQLRHYDALVDYSTVGVSVREVYEVTIEPEPVVTFGARFAQAFSEGVRGFLDGLGDIAVALAYSWLWLVLIAAVVVIILRVTRKKRAERRERRCALAEERKNAPPAPAPEYRRPAQRELREEDGPQGP